MKEKVILNKQIKDMVDVGESTCWLHADAIPALHLSAAFYRFHSVPAKC